LNRPVEALQDLQQSIRLNDNRAVYRSRLLLDQDHAARSTSLARIYNDLGFQQLALSEGWKSVNTDPSNHSAHRLLADSYSALPRHEIARVSELLQAQMLQPLNLNPIQPQLAESSLGILDGAGPTSASNNEFNPLFTRNRFSLQMNGVVAKQGNELEPNRDHNTRSTDLVHSAVWGRYSYSVGTFHDYNEGIRPNQDQDREIDNAFVQTAIDHNTSIQFEYRNTQAIKGDLPLRFDPTLYSNSERTQIDNRILRLGVRHDFKPGSTLLISAIGNRYETQTAYSDSSNTNVGPPFGTIAAMTSVNGMAQETGHAIELQHLQNQSHYQITSGMSSYRGNSHFNLDTTILTEAVNNCPPFCLSSTIETKISDETEAHHHNLYFYSLLNQTNNLTWTLGLSIDDIEIASKDDTQFNPKAGLTWQLTDSTTIRAAAFRSIKRTLVANQTLEPTQIAGFNQFYDDGNGTDSRRYGIALEKNYETLHFGMEVSKRDLEVPFPTALTNTTFQADWKEQMGRAYAYWSPLNWFAARAEYQLETFKRPIMNSVDVRDTSTGIPDLTTQQIPLGISLFSSQGTTTHITSTRVKQAGTFATDFTPTSATTEQSSDQFWVIDAAISYRLSKRLGRITIGAKNLLDKTFRYHNTDIAAIRIQPERTIFTHLSLSF